MSKEPTEILFEIDAKDGKVEAIGIALDVELEELKLLINGVDINRTMKISTLKIVKVL